MRAVAAALFGLGIAVGYAASHMPALAAEAPAKAACPWGPELDAVNAAPKNHRVLLENDRVRVLDVTVQPGERELLHAHCRPSVLYIMQRGALRDYDGQGNIRRDEKAPPEPLPYTQWHQTEPPHAVENLDSKVFHLLRIELKD